MIDQQIEIPTRDGRTTTFITHPERGGPHPIILFYMDAPVIREELRDMARRLGTSGYYVMLPNLYYRSGVMEIGPIPPDPEAPERKRMFGFMNSINIPLIMEDTRALLAYAEGQSAARTDRVGTVGYCMSGRYAINAATHFRIASRRRRRSTERIWRPISPTARIWPGERPGPSSISAAPKPMSTRRRRLSSR
jgi:carboxymethylenebutenolidase